MSEKAKYDIKLLLVEDDAIVREVYSRLLAKIISTIIVANNGETGYDLFEKENPDLILTDIKMPVMNGLDMIKKIRGNNSGVKILIMSAYRESRYFINAIEAGVKGFLTKPIKNDDLIRAVSEQANDILLERNLKEAEKKRNTAEIEREKSDKILNSLSEITATIFQYGVNDKSIEYGLKQIAEATQSTRSVIIKFVNNNNKTIAVVQNIYRKNADKVNYPKLPNNEIDVQSPIISRWNQLLTDNKIVGGNVREFEGSLRDIFERLGSKSIIITPIFVNEELWGGIVIEDSVKERDLSKNEEKAMKMVAYNLGAALYRQNVEKELINMNLNLEKMVRERTKALEIEIAERTNAQALLRQSEEKYRQIYENASDGILLIQDSIIVLVNPTMVMLMEKMPRDLIGKKFHSFIESSNKEDLKKFLKSFKPGHDDKPFEVLVSTKTVKEKWLELKINGIDWDGEPAYLLFASDISTRKEAQNSLKKLNKNLEQRIAQEINNVKQQQELLVQKTKLESLGELSAGLAHEINQPLGGISMGLENIIYKTSQNDLEPEYINSKINILFKDIDRIKQIIEHVRTFSREQQSASIKVFNVGDVINNSISLINRLYIHHHINLTVDIPEGEFKVLGNPFRLEQVFLNILSNAKSAVDKKMELEKGSDYQKEIKLSLETVDDHIFIHINDNGIGMPKEVVDKIFEPFFTTKDEESGTGLGLSISYGIIKEMKGIIRVESEPCQCTKLTIELPLIKN